MDIKLVSPVDGADYIRHARIETLRAVNGEINPATIEPTSRGTYLFAFARTGSQPIGMVEFTFHSQVYGSYQDTLYGSLADLNHFCPFEEMAGVRTIYVEPEYRLRRPIFLHLVLAASLLYRSRGASHATASTNANGEFLNGLYTKLGGQRLGDVRIAQNGDFAMSVFVFNLDQLLAHKAMPKVTREFDLDAALQPCLA